MATIFLTQNSTPIFKYIVWLLGLIMNGIFICIDKMGIPNIGLAIIIFTIITNVIILPLTIKQQKFSKLQNKIQPELNAVAAKWKNSKDPNAQMLQSQEQQAIYAKYGVSPAGSCGYLLIQMPILLALYRVIYAIPAYVTKIRETFTVLATSIINTDGGEFLKNSGVDTIQRVFSQYGKNMTEGNLTNGVIDVLHQLSSADMATVASHYNLNDLQYAGQYILQHGNDKGLINTFNSFLGLNIGNSPWSIIKDSFSAGQWGLIIGAAMIPILAAVTQWINTKLIPQPAQQDTGNDRANEMQSSMKMMNNIMPLMSVWFCLNFSCGIGIYWIASSVVRSIIQVITNKSLDNVDLNELIEKNKEKSAKKIAKMQENQERLNAYGAMKTKNIQTKASYDPSTKTTSFREVPDSDSVTKTAPAKPGSMMAKANMVRDYNERNNKN